MTRYSLALLLLVCLAAPATALAQSAGARAGASGARKKKKKPPEVAELEKLLARFDRAAADKDRAELNRIDTRLKEILRKKLAEGRRAIRASKHEGAADKASSKQSPKSEARRAYIERRRIALRLVGLRGKVEPAALKKKRGYIERLLALAEQEAARKSAAKKKSKGGTR